MKRYIPSLCSKYGGGGGLRKLPKSDNEKVIKIITYNSSVAAFNRCMVMFHTVA